MLDDKNLFRPIGSGNAHGDDIRVNFDKEGHGDGLPAHVDMVTRINTGITDAGAHKIRVNKFGKIITDEIT